MSTKNESKVTIHQQDKIEFPYFVKIAILIDTIFPVLKHNSHDDTRSCKRENNNPHNENTVDVLEIEPHIVGHSILLFNNVQEMSFSIQITS